MVDPVVGRVVTVQFFSRKESKAEVLQGQNLFQSQKY
jgi:hypothetical protein